MRPDVAKGVASDRRPSKMRSKEANSQADVIEETLALAGGRAPAAVSPGVMSPGVRSMASPWFWSSAITLAAVATWSYWPTLAYLVERWTAVADYSHGFLVAPIALYFLWARKDQFPHGCRAARLSGLCVVALAELLRVASARVFLTSLDGWSIPVWLAGLCLLFGGWRLLRWCLPSLTFLLFMVPLPYRVERLLSSPLQRISCVVSTWLLQCLGQPAIQEGNTVMINEVHLEVAKACSGSRIFLSIAAIAFVYCVLVRAPWWTKLSVWCSVLPVALAANALRIAGTGLLNVYFSGDAAHAFNHDAAGWLMMPLAAAMMAAVVWYVGRLLQEEETMTARQSLSGGIRSTT